MPRGLVCRLHRQSLQSTLVDDGGRTGRAVHEFEFASGDILALRKAVIDLEAFELCVIVAVVRPQHPRTLRVGCRRRDEQGERDEQDAACELHRLLPLLKPCVLPNLSRLNSSRQGRCPSSCREPKFLDLKDSGNGDA